MVNSWDSLGSFISGYHDMILFEDMDWSSISDAEKTKIFDKKNSSRFHTLYKNKLIPWCVPKCALVNEVKVK